jgi:2-keto-4-pentenoate hydratase/2-oxohepta-3-ene-1,7-dioic acid hydratase in catechol pathway
MKYVRFLDEGRVKYGAVEGERIEEISGDIFDNFQVTDKVHNLAGVKLLAPCEPTKVVLVGLNYIDHARELKMDLPSAPVIFLKPSTAVIGPEDTIIYPRMCKQLDYEAELAVVIKAKVKNIRPEEVKDCLLGYTCYNDVTARDLQKQDVQWTRAKSFDTFSPLGPYVVDKIDPGDLKIELRLNGALKQSSNTKNCVFGVERLISFISRIMTLLPGDVVTTGTPVGVGPMKAGDTVEVAIEKIGVLRNYVKMEI